MEGVNKQDWSSPVFWAFPAFSAGDGPRLWPGQQPFPAKPTTPGSPLILKFSSVK